MAVFFHSFFRYTTRTNKGRFGIMHVVLQVVPVLSILFLFTSAVGAALWAVEDQKRIFYATIDRMPIQPERRRRWWSWRRG